MAILDALKKISGNIGTDIKKSINQAQENARENTERRNLKRRLLSYFTRNQLDGMLLQYGESPLPNFRKDPITNEKYKTTMDDRINDCINKISLKNMEVFASKNLRNNPYVRDMIIEIDKWLDEQKKRRRDTSSQVIKTEGENTPISELTNLLNKIKVNFEETMGDQHYNTEDEFNKALVAWLRSRYGNKIEDPHNIHTGHSGDIVYNGEQGRYVLELKLAYGGSLDYGFKEIAEYKYSGEFKDIGVIIWDDGQMPYDSLKSEQRKLELSGAKVIIIKPRA